MLIFWPVSKFNTGSFARFAAILPVIKQYNDRKLCRKKEIEPTFPVGQPYFARIRGCCLLGSVPAAENNSRVGLARSMASAGARAYNGGMGRRPQRGSWGRAPGGESGGKNPLKLMAF